jgi:hypothetical protein
MIVVHASRCTGIAAINRRAAAMITVLSFTGTSRMK